ncbi:acetylxylan esterase [Candidatus Poribacteria bacterium]|nr:acetylxylan esterase [Candidatus Poribacteria bacterium]
MKKNVRFAVVAQLLLLFIACDQPKFPIDRYYDYDSTFPLEDSVRIETETDEYVMYYVTYRSFHDAMVTGLLTIPKNASAPVPTIIFLHGIQNHKQTDYMEVGHQYFIASGYAVMRIDIANHGDRKIHDYDFGLTEGYRYWTRDIAAQTVFDLRRATDFLQTQSEIDSERIGFFGISLGGIIGTVFCGVDKRIKVPVIALAGGGMHLAFKLKAFAPETRIFLSIIDPINFVEKIAPRPLLMLNAENDEVVSPLTSRNLYRKAGHPKKIVWYPTKHGDVPLNQAFPEAIKWFKEHL